VDVLAARQRVTLLVVPPETSVQAAHDALMTAGHRGNTDDVAALLGSPEFVPRIVRSASASSAAENEAEPAQQR
jgi:Mg-chelatase subunit ChlD